MLTNKYAEGYPGKRYYGGCEHVDVIEQLAIDRAKALFGAEHANVQPHAGAQANTAVYHALLQPGDTIMGLALPHGGHLTHGMKINVSGRLYDIAPYEVSPEDAPDRHGRGRADRARAPAEAAARRLVGLPAPARLRALPRDRRRGRRAPDGRHGALRRARRGGLHPNPVPLRRRRHDDRAQDDRRRPRRADPVPRGVREEDQLGRLPRPAGRAARARDRGQGGRAAGSPRRRAVPRAPGAHASRARRRSRTSCSAAGDGVNVLTGGTDVHLVLVDLRDSELDGRQAEDRLHEIGITVNRNAVPFDPRPPAVSSGPARRRRRRSPPAACRPTTSPRSGAIIAAALQPGFERREGRAGRARRRAIADRYPLYAHLRAPARPSDARGDVARRSTRAARAGPAILSGAMKDDALLGFLVALVVAALLTPLVARLARRVGAVDAVKERGLAREATPLLGGLAIFAAVLVGRAAVPADDAVREGHPRRRGADHRRRRARRLARARRRAPSSPARSTAALVLVLSGVQRRHRHAAVPRPRRVRRPRATC